jgi:hypothetical protein
VYFLYGELLALILGSFAVGSAVARTAVRLLVPATQPQSTDISTAEPDVFAMPARVVG